MASAKRKLNFDSPASGDTTCDDPDFPKEWKIAGMDIEARLQQLREEMKGRGLNPGVATVDKKSKFRTEYRKIVAARNLLTDALRHHEEKVQWFRKTNERLSGDIEALHRRREFLDKTVSDLKAQLALIDSSVGILKSQQLAVKSVLELREDEYDVTHDSGDDVDSTLPDQFRKFSEISKLCAVALKSYETVKRENEKMEKELIMARNLERKEKAILMNQMDEESRKRVEKIETVFKDFSLEQLKALRDRLKKK